MIAAKSYAAYDPKSSLKPFEFHRRNPRENDVVIDIYFCGVCHSDIHQARDEWGGSIFPMVPGHEIVGYIKEVGSEVKCFKAGDYVGVGCFVDSCRTCSSCKDGLEQYCEEGMVGTYNSRERDHKTPTYGGYSSVIVVDQNYVLKIPSSIPPHKAAPLLCAGITTYSPLRHWKLTAGQRLGVVGLGGLGHMAVKLGKAIGATCTVFSTSDHKREDALQLGADQFVNTKKDAWADSVAGKFDLILDTVSAHHDLAPYLQALKRDATLVLVGVPPDETKLHAFSMILGRKSIAGSLIGGIQETQEMLNFCGEHGIGSDVEVIKLQQINEAYERMLRSDVKYRFVVDLKKSF